MHHTRKKKAIALIGEEKDPIAITKLLLDNQFTDEEVTEVIASLSTEGEAPIVEEEAPALSAGTGIAPAKAETPSQAIVKKSQYLRYDLWQVEISRKERTDPASRQKVVDIDSFTAIKKLRENVKLEDSVVGDLNAQSHNSLRRYYLAGSITNGHVQKANITTAAN
jgi:hypothetical protein